MERFQALMTRRVAGIPVGVIAVVVAAVVLVVALRMKGSTTDTTETTDDEPTGDADIGGEVTNPIFQASPSSSTVVSVPEEVTNEVWGKKAREWLVVNGVTPSQAQQLVSKYLNSEPLTGEERNKIDTVIAAIGFPPDPPDLIDMTPDEDTDTTTDPNENPSGGGEAGPTGGDNAPPSKQGEPPTHHVIKNARDNGPGELARIYYGSNAPQKVARLEAANWELGQGPWAVGTRVKIPDDHPPVYFTATHAVRGLNEIAAKNSVSKDFIKTLNPGMNFPVAAGTKVRVN